MTAIGQLAGGIAHDFNNQLAGILGYADMLKEKLENEKHKHYAENIRTAARRAATLTQQLLAFGRKGKNLSVSVNIHSLIQEVVSLLTHSIDKRISIVKNLHADASIIQGDPSQVQNAILNLAINARDAMDDGGTLTFETEHVTLDDFLGHGEGGTIPPGEYIKLSVSDTGAGIPVDIRHRIFEPFFTTKEQGKGTGMGLAGVYGTIRNHLGSILVESVEGKGTRFDVYLPLQATPYEPGATSGQRCIRGTGNLLLIDDEIICRELARDLLQDLGYNVITFEDGASALTYYRSNWQRTDLVILDMVMPKMNGRQTYQAMKEINPEVRAILSSGYTINGEAQAILDEGVLAFVGKPFEKTELSQRIAQALGFNDQFAPIG
jgi:CheY-like chemotaxis protein